MKKRKARSRPADRTPPPAPVVAVAAPVPALFADDGRRRVLNVGCGRPDPERRRLHRAFHAPDWRELRLDIAADVEPDILADITDMRAAVPDASVDALWSSHNVEHLEAHRVAPAFAEFARVLKPDGFALVTCPDLGAIARFIVDHDADTVAYDSVSGPITPVDMLWGHGASIAAGAHAMAHRTGFTRRRLAVVALAAGFVDVRTQVRRFDLWALLLKPATRIDAVLAALAGTEQASLAETLGERRVLPVPPR